MSYDISLRDPETGEVLHLSFAHLMHGGIFSPSGTTAAHLNITYNYAEHFVRVLGEQGIRTIYGMTGADSIPILLQAIERLLDDVDEDYWKPTEGNARLALCNLLELARMRPDGVWDGD